jgi:hypothetical protein
MTPPIPRRAQIPTNASAAVAFVADHSFGAMSWASAPAPFDAARFHQRLKHRLLVPLAGGEPEYHRLALALRTEMELGAEPASTASQCFISSAFACSRCMLMGTNHRPVDEMKRPVHASMLVCSLLQSREELLPEPALLPGVKSVGDRTPGAIVLWQVAPRSSSSQNPQDAIEDYPMRVIGVPPFLRSFGREQGGQALPLRESRVYVFAQPLSVSHLPNTP